MQILRSLLKTIADTANGLVQLSNLYQNINKLDAIGLGVIGYLMGEYKAQLLNENLKEQVDESYDFFKTNNVSLYPLTKNIFSAPFSELISEELSLINSLDKKEVNFFTRLYKLPTKIQNHVYTQEPYFVNYFTEKASLHFLTLIESVVIFLEKVIEKYNSVLGPQGTIQNLLHIKGQLGNNVDLQKYVKLTVATILSNITKLSSYINEHCPAYHETLKSMIGKLNEVNAQKGKKVEVKVEESYKVPDELSGAMEQIVKFAELEVEEYNEFKKHYNQFKLIEEKLSGDDSVKRVRKTVTEFYWKIYEKSFVKYYQSMKMIRPVDMMLRYGFFDEELVNPRTIVAMYNTKPEPIDELLPIYDAIQWLEKIAKEEISPSINGMGETYEKHLREEAKRRSRRTIVTPEEIDSTEYRINFEIKNMFSDCGKVCSGEIFNYSPILIEQAFNGEGFKYFIEKKKMKEEFFKLRSLDFGAFYREVRYRNPEAGIEEFVQQEILPNVVMLPTWGKRPMTWMVKERLKNSRGRIIFPHFIIESLPNILVQVFGVYRWEIIKEILGPLWNDITKMSLTAEYTDYIQYYKKNKDLTLETKEKIRENFKKFRSDRDRFVNDYSKWIKFETQGRPMVNKVVRNIFYRHVAFPKETRDKLKELPAYSEIYVKYGNLKRKEIKRLKNKYHKYTKKGQPLPPELEENINMQYK